MNTGVSAKSSEADTGFTFMRFFTRANQRFATQDKGATHNGKGTHQDRTHP